MQTFTHRRDLTGKGPCGSLPGWGGAYGSCSQHGVALGISHVSVGKIVLQDPGNPVVVPFLGL